MVLQAEQPKAYDHIGRFRRFPLAGKVGAVVAIVVVAAVLFGRSSAADNEQPDKPGTTEFTGPITPGMGADNEEYIAILQHLGAGNDAINPTDPSTSGFRMTLKGRELIVGLVESQDSPATRVAITARVTAANPKWTIVWQLVPFSGAQLLKANDQIAADHAELQAAGADVFDVTIRLEGLQVNVREPSTVDRAKPVLQQRYGPIIAEVISAIPTPAASRDNDNSPLFFRNSSRQA
ncbi:MAG: hypothetical protein H7270_15485 [Dermatophilaceae bacterium]|nr:hypothetical protein [Dermatophilaceae bacterium]